MKAEIKFFKLALFFYLLIASFSFASDNIKNPPDLILADIYQNGIELKDYWVSEKLDGVRAYWNGKHLISRQGNIFHSPEWFTAALPDTALDGELWLGRQQFDQLSGLVRRQSPDPADWKNIKYMAFDLPHDADTFDHRLNKLEAIIGQINSPHIKLVEQFKIASHLALQQKLDDIVNQGGEGLMLHLGSSLYKSGRSTDLLKLKKHFDAEAIVISHIPGKGKYKGMLGSIVVETGNNKRFKIGTGFSDQERKNPPAIGSTITYKYFGLTNNGTPRFASFVRLHKPY